MKTYNDHVKELWNEAKESPLLAGLSLSTMSIDDEPIRVHCLLTTCLIRELELVKAELLKYQQAAG